MHRRLARPGHQRRGQHGRVRGRAGQEVRLPPLLGHPRAPTTPPPWPRSSAAGSPGTSRRRPTVGTSRASPPRQGRPRRFAYPPNLLVVDGGAPQVAAASRSLAELGIVDVAVCGLAKRMEEVWLPGEPDPLILPRTSEALYLLQRVRDEAHRFAITYHRQKRSTSMLVSLLDDVPGLGDTRRKALMKQFGSLKRLRAASIEELMAVPGIGRRTAEAVQAAIAEPGEAPAAGRAGAGPGVGHGAAGAGRARHAAPRRPATPPRSGWWPRDDDRAGSGRPQRDVPPGLDPATTETPPLEVVVVTGLSGAGKNSAGRVLEDLGWFVVDNLPPGAAAADGGARRARRPAPLRRRRGRAQPRLLQRPAGGDPGPRRGRAPPAGGLRARPRRGAGPPLRVQPPRAPPAGQRHAHRRHRRGAGPADRHRRRGRPLGRHQRPERARSCAPPWRTPSPGRAGPRR